MKCKSIFTCYYKNIDRAVYGTRFNYIIKHIMASSLYTFFFIYLSMGFFFMSSVKFYISR